MVKFHDAGYHRRAVYHGAAHAALNLVPVHFHVDVEGQGIIKVLVVLGFKCLVHNAVFAEGCLGCSRHQAAFCAGNRALQNPRGEPLAVRTQIVVEGAFHLADGFAVAHAVAELTQHGGQLQLSGVKVCRAFGVHHAGGVSTGEVVNHLPGSTHGGILVCFLGVGTQVGQQQSGYIGAGLHGCGILGMHIGAVDNVLTGGLGCADGIFIHHAIARAVDEHSAVLHLVNQLCIDEVAGGGAARHVQGDDVGFRKDFVNLCGDGADVESALLGEEVVIAEHLAFKALQALHEQAANVAQPHDTHGLVSELAAHVLLLVPFACAGGGICRHHISVGGQNHGNHLFCHGVGVCAGGVHHVDILCAGVDIIDVVIAGACANHTLEPGQGIHDFGCDFFGTDDDAGGIGMSGHHVFDGDAVVLHNIIPGSNQRGGCGLVEFGRNQNLHIGIL